jgi:hydrogenase maturation protease
MRQLLDQADKTTAGNPRCRVLALGSPHGDDRAPWLVADRLAELEEFAVSVFKVSSPFEIVGHVDCGVDLIVIDVCFSGAPLGTVVRLNESNLRALSSGLRTSHGGSLIESIELAAALGRRPRSLCVLAVEMNPSDAVPGRTEASQHCIEPLWTQLLAELSCLQDRINCHCT